MKRLRRYLLLLILAGSVYAGWRYRDPLLSLYQKRFAGEAPTEEKERLEPDPDAYQDLREKLAKKRVKLAHRYARARTAVEISSVIRESEKVLESFLPALMRCWLGTPHDYHGTCRLPGSGEIACGYFVSTILLDADFRVERYRLAQQASQDIIETFLPRNKMHISAGLDYARFLEKVISRGPGVRLVGLDNHVAFLIVPPSGDLRFIHSSGGLPKCVVDEDREQAESLQRSHYRVIGNLTRNPEVIHAWLTGAPWPTHRTPSS